MTEIAFIFDLDGVIVDTAIFHYKAWKRLANEKFGKDLSVEQNERLKGVSRTESLNILLEMSGISNLTDSEKEELAAIKNRWYVEYISQITPSDILPGVSNFLHEVKELNIKTAIGSASKNTRLLLDRIGLLHMFDSIVDGTKVSKAKPDPEVFLKCAEELQEVPRNCIVFEDAVAGVEAAKAGGMFSVGVGNEKTLFKADKVISTFEGLKVNDVLNFLKK
jgi:beta-phosphoglucomutase